MSFEEIQEDPSFDKIKEHLEKAITELGFETEQGYAVNQIRLALRSLENIRKFYVVVAKWRAEEIADFKCEQEARLTAETRLAHRTRTISLTVRSLVFARDQGRCRYCGRKVEGSDIHMDHFEPEGPGDEANIVTACRACNLRKRDIRPRQLFKRRGMKLLGKQPETPPTLAEYEKAVSELEVALAAEVSKSVSK